MTLPHRQWRLGAAPQPVDPTWATQSRRWPTCAGTLARWSSTLRPCHASGSQREALRLPGASLISWPQCLPNWPMSGCVESQKSTAEAQTTQVQWNVGHHLWCATTKFRREPRHALTLSSWPVANASSSSGLAVRIGACPGAETEQQPRRLEDSQPSEFSATTRRVRLSSSPTEPPRIQPDQQEYPRSPNVVHVSANRCHLSTQLLWRRPTWLARSVLRTHLDICLWVFPWWRLILVSPKFFPNRSVYVPDSVGFTHHVQIVQVCEQLFSLQ